jgi:hypothetical protein
MAVADSITELINMLEGIKTTWKKIDNASLKNDGKRRNAPELTPAILVSVVNALDAHSNGVDQLLYIMDKGMPVAQRVTSKGAAAAIELPQEPPKAARGPFAFLRGGPERKDNNLGAYNMV